MADVRYPKLLGVWFNRGCDDLIIAPINHMRLCARRYNNYWPSLGTCGALDPYATRRDG